MLRDNSAVNRASNVFINLFMAAFLFVIFFPMFFMLTASLKPAREIFAMPYRWIPTTLYTRNFFNAIAGNDRSFIFVRNTLNSLYVAALTAVLCVIVSAAGGYGLSKFKFRGQNLVFLLIMRRMTIPFEAIMIPMYIT
ncbi:MAG: carbohydrate ABC transporter permease, partial [Treponema sp.]|nr:carbohydrate ABC transporter permease [Treponema sp.]